MQYWRSAREARKVLDSANFNPNPTFRGLLGAEAACVFQKSPDFTCKPQYCIKMLSLENILIASHENLLRIKRKYHDIAMRILPDDDAVADRKDSQGRTPFRLASAGGQMKNVKTLSASIMRPLKVPVT